MSQPTDHEHKSGVTTNQKPPPMTKAQRINATFEKLPNAVTPLKNTSLKETTM